MIEHKNDIYIYMYTYIHQAISPFGGICGFEMNPSNASKRWR